jgi:YegS/Rv2252/BmrU family lipid kinase
MSAPSSNRTFVALINPISGGGHASEKWAPVADLLRAAGVQARAELTESREHAVSLAASAAREGHVVVAVGGDGLVRDVTEGVAASNGVMGIVPAGRGNDLARYLGLPGDPSGLAQVLLAGRERVSDIIDVADTVVVGNVYVGIDSVSNQVINDNRWIPGLLVYRLAPLKAALRWKAPTYTLTIDGEPRTVKAHTVIVANSGAYGHGLRIVPVAEIDSGALKVMYVGGPKWKIGRFMSEAKKGKHLDRPECTVVDAHEVLIEADRPVPVYGDGEYLAEMPVTVKVRPQSIRILV